MNKNLHMVTAMLILCCLFLCPLPKASGQVSSLTPSASFATWKDNKKAAYTIIHDDYSSYIPGIFQNAYPLAKDRGIKICFGAITNFCGETEWNNAKTMIADGHECVNHSHNHKCGGTAGQCAGQVTYGSADFATELGTSSQFIETNTGVKPRFFIHPYDAPSDDIINYLKTLGYLGSRAGTQLSLNTHNFTDFMRLNFYVYDGTPAALAGLNPAIDAAIAAGGYALREFHGIDDGIDPTAFKGFGVMTLADYTSHLNYVKSKIDDGSIWSATATEAITYKMQRDAFNPLTNYDILGNKLTVSFANLKTIDPSVLTTPVTLNINIGSLKGNFTVIQNGKVILFTRKDAVVSLNIYPHQGSVVLQGEVIVPPPPPPPPPVFCIADGKLTRSIWQWSPYGGALNDLTVAYVKADVEGKGTVPKVDYISIFTSRTTSFYYLEQVKGYYIPLQTGAHSFVITGDDDTELYMSPDSDPNKKVQVAGFHGKTTDLQFTKYRTQKTRTMYLQAGKPYYIELWHIGWGTGNFATVRAQTPSSSYFAIYGWNLSSKACNTVPVLAQASARSLAFNGRLEHNKAVLNWAIKSSDVLDYFELEKLDGQTGVFRRLDVINANLPTNTLQYFSYDDTQLSEGENIYRLKTVAQDASIQYSNSVKVRYEILGNYTLFPNPAGEFFDIDLTAAGGRAVDIAIITPFGYVIKQEKIAPAKQYRIDLSDFPSGQYFIKIQPEGKRVTMKKLVVMK